MMYDHEKSDSAIAAVKPTNKAGQPAAELAEPRAGAEGECEPAKHGPGTVPGNRVTGAGAHTEFCENITVAPSHTRGGSRMPELGSYGSVRGARGNSRPYRENDRPTVKTALMTHNRRPR
jgi:hypothetical protein